jgi:hypothetical protein
LLSKKEDNMNKELQNENKLPEEIQKITHGFVVQTFNTSTKKLVDESLITGKDVEFEDTEGNPLDSTLDPEDFVSDFGPMTPNEVLESARQLAEYSLAEERRDYVQVLAETNGMDLSSHAYVLCLTILDRLDELPTWDAEKEEVVYPNPEDNDE